MKKDILCKNCQEPFHQYGTVIRFCSAKCSNVYKGKNYPISEETRKKISESLKGKIVSEETREKLRVALKGRKSPSGENSYHWKGGITPRNKLDRTSIAFKEWRDAVFKRDNYSCQICDDYGVHLHADHVKAFAEFPELRFEVTNGRSLCRPCHYYVTFKKKMPAHSKWAIKGEL